MKCPACGYCKFPVHQGNSRWDDVNKCQVRYHQCPECGYKEKGIEPIYGPEDEKKPIKETGDPGRYVKLPGDKLLYIKITEA